jgi:hypothetical protein
MTFGQTSTLVIGKANLDLAVAVEVIMAELMQVAV